MQPPMGIPDQFRAAQFAQKNGPLELKQTQLGEVKADECVIKVHLCALHSTDEMLKHDLLPDMRCPMTPGGLIVGEIVKSAQQGQRKLKEGTRVVAISFMRGVLDHHAVSESAIVELSKVFHPGDKELEAPIWAFDATRIWVAHERCHDELKRMPDAERRVAKDLNERMGFKGDGDLVLHGEGGFAKVALDTIKMAKQDRKVILVASSDRWQAGDYGLKDECMLVVGKHNLADELKKLGGAQGIMCGRHADPAVRAGPRRVPLPLVARPPPASSGPGHDDADRQHLRQVDDDPRSAAPHAQEPRARPAAREQARHARAEAIDDVQEGESGRVRGEARRR